MNKINILKQYFGHTLFREGQEEIIDNILSGTDVLAIMPTGAGKSVCYQVPALLLDGLTLVISPLISLMKDQVNALVQSGIKAAFLNSSLSLSQQKEVYRRALNGAYQMIYVAPERLLTEDFQQFSQNVKIAMVTVDEAHCVSQWGQDFRPHYLKIVEFIKNLPYRPIISAFTATATIEVRNDILHILGLNNPFVIVTGFDRTNLYFEVRKPQSKMKELISILEQRQDKCGIIYCSTRKNVEMVCEKLNDHGFSATRYHAGLTDDERHNNQDDFIYDRKNVIAATNAFGMGIDKSNVSYVIHYNMPKSVEEYYQEAGRAGRDGEPADCIILYHGQDVVTNEFIIRHSNEENEVLTDDMRQAVKAKELERLKRMTFYCTTTDCLREYILKYFGEKTQSYCANCSNCNTNFETVDITIEAQKIVCCVARIDQWNRSFGKNMVADILHGDKSEKIMRMGLNKLSTYGIMADAPKNRILKILNFLIDNEYLMLSVSQYPVVRLTSKSKEIIKEKKTIEMKLPIEVKPLKKIITQDQFNVDMGLFNSLRELRNKIAGEKHLPAYIIFADAALKDMCRKLPKNCEEFLLVSGVGKAKMERYGELFTGHIAQYLSQNPNLKKTDTAASLPIGYREKVIQGDYPTAYQPWTEKEDLQLAEEYNRRMTIQQMSKAHQRTKGAIRSRLKKLEIMK